MGVWKYLSFSSRNNPRLYFFKMSDFFFFHTVNTLSIDGSSKPQGSRADTS